MAAQRKAATAARTTRRVALEVTEDELRTIIVTLELARLLKVIPKHLRKRAKEVEAQAAAAWRDMRAAGSGATDG